VIEAAAINGVGVTATLRAAIARILENLKNQVDTTLHEQPELAAPNLTAKAGATPASAGTPKLAVGMQAPTFVKRAAAAVEEDPFGAAVVSGANGSSREHLESLLGSARQLIASLESTLDRAREHEREISDKLAQL